jgi:hypothetical protein
VAVAWLLAPPRSTRTRVLRELDGREPVVCWVADDRRSGRIQRHDEPDLTVGRRAEAATFVFVADDGEVVATATKVALVRERFRLDVRGRAFEVVRVKGPLRRRWHVRALDTTEAGDVVQHALLRTSHALDLDGLDEDARAVVLWLLTAMQHEPVARPQEVTRELPGDR